MNKKTYEYLNYMVDELYKKLDNISMSLCGLKNNLNNVSEILRREYKNKYKKTENFHGNIK